MVGRRATVGKNESGRHDTNDFKSMAIQLDTLPDDRTVTGKMFLPKRV